MSHKTAGSSARCRWEVAGSGPLTTADSGMVVFIRPDRPGLWVALTLTLDGTKTITSMEIRQQRPGQSPDAAIGTRLLRSLPLGEMAGMALQELQRRADQGIGGLPADDDSGREALLLSLALRSVPLGHKRPGRRGHPDRYYAGLAVRYEEWQRTGQPLSSWARREHLSESALRAALGTARRKEFLTAAPRGKAGGRATDLAKALLGLTESE